MVWEFWGQTPIFLISENSEGRNGVKEEMGSDPDIPNRDKNWEFWGQTPIFLIEIKTLLINLRSDPDITKKS